MPIRYGKVTRFVLLNLYLRDAYSVAELATKERKALRQMRRKLLAEREREARTEATEMVREVAHNMLLSGKPVSAAATARHIEQLTAEILEEKLLSKREQLKTAVQVGIYDSAAGRYSEFASKAALSKHLRMLSKKD